MQEGFACMCVCIPHGCLVPVEARGVCQISWNQVFCIYSLAVSKPLGAPSTKQRTQVHLWYRLQFRFHVANDAVAFFVDDWSQHGKQLALDHHWSWWLIQQQSKKSSSTFFPSYPTQPCTGYSLRRKTAGCSAWLSEKSLEAPHQGDFWLKSSVYIIELPFLKN